MRRLLLSMLIPALLVSACAGSTRTVHGVVIEIDGELDDIRGFELVRLDGERITLRVAPDSDFHDLPLSHLNEHRISGAPVIVEYEKRGDELIVLALRDG